jgi:hypothetical protein
MIESEIKEIIDRETQAWNEKSVNKLLSLIEKDHISKAVFSNFLQSKYI